MDLVFRQRVSRGGFTLGGPGHELFRAAVGAETRFFPKQELQQLAARLYEEHYGESLYEAMEHGVYYELE